VDRPLQTDSPDQGKVALLVVAAAIALAVILLLGSSFSEL
jgi:hypothetical protein